MYYAGIDVSVEESPVCAIDGSGKIVREGKVPSEPEALIAWFSSLGVKFTRIGLEAGPLSQWLHAGMQQAGRPTLEKIANALLSVRTTLWRELDGFEKRIPHLGAIARSDVRARLLITTPGVGIIVALTFASAIDDPSRFTSSKGVGPHFGLTPTRYQSGETDYSGRISKHTKPPASSNAIQNAL